MFAMMDEFMTCATLPLRQCNLILISALAGTVLPLVGHFGITNWPKFVIRLDVLDVDSAMEALRDAVKSDDFNTYSEQVKLLLKDCACLPRLVKFTYDAWSRARDSEMTEFVTYLRTNLFADVHMWVDTILSGDRFAVKRMVRLCLTGDKVSHISELEMGECFKGCVYWREADGDDTYMAPPLLLHALACKFKVHTNLVLLRPQSTKRDVLEHAFLDGLHARLCLNEGAECPLGRLLPWACGHNSLLEIVVKIGRNIKFVNEKFQLYLPSQKRFRYVEDDILETENEFFKLPRANLLSKVRDCGYIVDGRLFLEGTCGSMYELWFHLKGQEGPLSANEVDKLVNAALNARFDFPGRRRVYVLVSGSGSSFSELDERWTCRDILLFDKAGLDKFIP
ncbi:hypothetical protein L7F22_059252 [Adiantum nelumboides]|nr:hypothetical protein [Adiantum nelumboides]